MEESIRIQSALISVYHKQGLEQVARQLIDRDVRIYSTGGTADYLRQLGADVKEVADLTGYPSILGGRVKTLHPKVHGGILARRGAEEDRAELTQFGIPAIDLVLVDLYPFEDTVRSGANEATVIEKIDIGGIALIRAAAKNYRYVACVPSQAHYTELAELLQQQDGQLSLAQRRHFSAAAFAVSSHYDTEIFRYLSSESGNLKITAGPAHELRYGENPHQQAHYYGALDQQFEQLNGKALSFNNLVDIDGALRLVDEFEEPFFAIIKHTNPCGCAMGSDLLDAWKRALAGDPVSAFGGILACNGRVEVAVAKEINELFFEVLVAEDFSAEALEVLKQKKNRILLRRKSHKMAEQSVKTVLDGYLVQEVDSRNLESSDLRFQSSRKPSQKELVDIFLGDKVVKHLKSNAIALVKEGQLIGSGVGQTSRIDALRQAMDKAEAMGFDLKGAVLVSDAFFPFKDSVEMAYARGIEVVVEPGGSKRDDETIEYCEQKGLCLVFTGIRHFKH